jgi:hypothetical protein
MERKIMQLVETKELCDRLLRSSAWLRKWKALGKFKEGIHYSKTGKTAPILWRVDLVMDRIVNWNDDLTHQRAIDNFVASLPSNQRKSPKTSRQVG